MIRKKLLLLLFILNFLSNFIYAKGLSKEKINELFQNGKNYFNEANEQINIDPIEAQKLYQKSAMHFEKIIDKGGIKNGKLYYNIGNIYFKMNDIGNAILNYKKALQYIPNDTNLQQNLDFARSNRIDKFDNQQKEKILKTIFFWHYDISNRFRIIIFIFFFVLTWIFALVRLFKKNSFIGFSFIISIVMSVLFLSSLLIEEWGIQNIYPGVITSDQVIAKKGNSNTYESAFNKPLHSGTEFSLIEQRDNWYYIQLPNSSKCWIPSKSAELVR